MTRGPRPPAVEQRLLRLIWGDGPDRTNALPPPDAARLWRDLDALAARHRLRPLLHHRLHALDGVPAEVRAKWAATHRRSALRAMRQRATAARIAAILAGEGEAALLLKGGALLWRGWTDPALRPMRDIDLLVPDGDASRLHGRLRAAGFMVLPGPASAKHLPALQDPVTGCHLEIHRRLLDGQSAADRAREAVLRGAVRASGEPFLPGLDMCGATETLLHLILHAAADHQFNNGPLLMWDMTLLVAPGRVDWPRFWRLAAAARAERSCHLVLRMAERHAGIGGVDWRGASPLPLPDRVVEAAVGLMLVPSDRVEAVGRLGRYLARVGTGTVLGDRGRVHGFMRGTPSVPRQVGERGPALIGFNRSAAASFALIRSAGRRHLGRMLLVAGWLARG